MSTYCSFCAFAKKQLFELLPEQPKPMQSTNEEQKLNAEQWNKCRAREVIKRRQINVRCKHIPFPVLPYSQTNGK